MITDTRRDISDQEDVLDLDPITVLECYRHNWLESLKEGMHEPEEYPPGFFHQTVNGILGFQAAIDLLEA